MQMLLKLDETDTDKVHVYVEYKAHGQNLLWRNLHVSTLHIDELEDAFGIPELDKVMHDPEFVDGVHLEAYFDFAKQ